MKPQFQIKSIVLGVLLGAIAMIGIAADSTSTQPVKIKWQFETFDSLPGSLAQQLDGLADNGWEIVSVSAYALPNSTMKALIVAKIPKK
jgi:ABC-type nitrate/sulfonate/bicarbonate transport system substrate-binding protein